MAVTVDGVDVHRVDRRSRCRRAPGGHRDSARARAFARRSPCAAGSTSRRSSAAARRSRSAASAVTRAGRFCAGDVLAVGDDVGGPRRRPCRRAWHRVLDSEWEHRRALGPHSTPELSSPPTASTTSLRADVGGALQLGAHRRPADRADARGGRRPDGGDAGLHPSNIHDTGYAIGAVDLTGDMPVILGPGRAEPRRVRLPGRRGRLGAVEARPAAPRRHGAPRALVAPTGGGERRAAGRSGWRGRRRAIEPVARPAWNGAVHGLGPARRRRAGHAPRPPTTRRR